MVFVIQLRSPDAGRLIGLTCEKHGRDLSDYFLLSHPIGLFYVRGHIRFDCGTREWSRIDMERIQIGTGPSYVRLLT